MPTHFFQPINNASSTLAAPHSIGGTSISLAAGTGPLFGSPTPSAPIRITIQKADSELLTIFACTGRTADTLTGLSIIEGSTDRIYSISDTVEARATAGTFGDIHTAVNSLETDLATIELTPGPKGDKGDTGLQGIQGPKGDTGSQGIQGPKGDTGATGAASTVPGPQGPKGDTGDTGPSGVINAPLPLAYNSSSQTVTFVGPIVTGQVTGLDSDLSAFSAHTANTSNPHGTTKAQIGLGNVDNTGDAAKPISTATQTALDGKAPTSHAHSASDIVSGVISTSHLGSGSPSAGKYVDGGTGAWTTLPTGGGSTSPGGSSGQVQYNNGSAFAGAAGITYDASNNRVGIGSGTIASAGVLTVCSTTQASSLLITGKGLASSSPTNASDGVGIFLNYNDPSSTNTQMLMGSVSGLGNSSDIMFRLVFLGHQFLAPKAIIDAVDGTGSNRKDMYFGTDTSSLGFGVNIANNIPSYAKSYTELEYNKTFVVRAANTQSANIQSWENSSGTSLASVSASGALTLTATMSDANAPANSLFRGSDHSGGLCFKNSAGTVTVIAP